VQEKKKIAVGKRKRKKKWRQNDVRTRGKDAPMNGLAKETGGSGEKEKRFRKNECWKKLGL